MNPIAEDNAERVSGAASPSYLRAMEHLVEVVQDLSLARDLPTVMGIVRLAARDLTGADGATFILRDGDQCFYAEENAIAPLWKGRRFSMEQCASGWVMLNRQAALIEDIYADPRVPAEAYRPTFVKSLAMVPIRTRDPVGAIGNYWARRFSPAPEQVRILQALADTTAVALENVRIYGELEQRIRDLAALMRAAPLAIVSLDPDGAPKSWNPAAERLFGVSPGVALAGDCPGIDPGARTLFRRLVGAMRAGDEIRGESLMGLQHGGESIDLRLWGAPVAENGALRAMLLVAQDETERNRLERQFLQSQKMEAVGQLTGGIAHDFNNLLGILIGNLDIVRERVDGNPELCELVDAGIEAGLRGADLNKRLLAFSRRQALQPEEVDVNAAVGGIIALLRRSLGERVEIRLSCDDAAWTVRVDPTQLETAVVNLCINARDAMPQGGVLMVETCNVTIDDHYADSHEEVLPGDYVMASVSDNGQGMTPEILRRVFEPFFTTKPVGQGTGLGLPMVYGFMKQSNGHISIYSEPGRGTTVRLYLPRSAGGGVRSDADLQAAPALSSGQELILIVEDNPDMRDLARRQCLDLGYRVVEAENADRALELVELGLKPDLLFADVIMPGSMGGFDLAGRLRRKWPELAVLMSSGFTERAARDMHHPDDGEVRPYTLLSKPYRKTDLVKALREAFDAPRGP